MTEVTFHEIENYMQSCMSDSAHDQEHVYRVLYNALNIADGERDVDLDVLISACLLHDIGRQEQFENPSLCHAEVGGQKAYDFLIKNGFENNFSLHVKSCIETHRFRKSNPPRSIEAKILFDADKLDVTGAIGIARTLIYKGQVSEPLYTLLPDGQIDDGYGTNPSFFHEYRYKLENIYDTFYTLTGRKLAEERRKNAENFFLKLKSEIMSSYTGGQNLLDRALQ